MKHTQGKWTASIGTTGASINVNNDYNHPLSFGLEYPDIHNSVQLNREGMANARLIASAPEMLKALKMVKKAWENSEVNFECNESNGTGYLGTHHLIKKTLDVIGKVEGGE